MMLVQGWLLMTNEEAARALAVRYRKPLIGMMEEVIEERCYNLLLILLNEMFPKDNNDRKR